MHWNSASRALLAALFAAAGTLHFIFPTAYLGIMPPFLPFARELVYASGVFAVAGGVGLLVPRARRVAGIGLVLFLLAVWPANLQMLLDARASAEASGWEPLLWVRLVLQLALIGWVWHASLRRRGAEVRG